MERYSIHAHNSESRGNVLSALRKVSFRSCGSSQEGKTYFWEQEVRGSIWKDSCRVGEFRCAGGCEETRKVQLQKNRVGCGRRNVRYIEVDENTACV